MRDLCICTLSLLCLIATASAAHAKSYRVEAKESQTKVGGEAAEQQVRSYIVHEKTIGITAGETGYRQYIDAKAQTFTLLDDRRQTYLSTPLEQVLREFSEPFSYFAQQESTLKTGLAGVNVGSWPTKKAVITYKNGAKVELYLADKTGLDMADFKELYTNIGRASIFGKHFAELDALKGFPVRINASFSLVSDPKQRYAMNVEITKIELKPLSLEAFSIPKTYKKLDLPIDGGLPTPQPPR